MEQANKKYKQTLVYLYEKFEGNQELIIKELVENNLKPSIKDIKEFIRVNHLHLTNYTCFWEKSFPKALKEGDEYILIIHNKLDKSVKKFLNYELEDDFNNPNGGTSYYGQTLKEFLDESGLKHNITLREANEILLENGIKPVKW